MEYPPPELETVRTNHTKTQTRSPDTSPFKRGSASNAAPRLNAKLSLYSWALHCKPAQTGNEEPTPRTYKTSSAVLTQVIFRVHIQKRPRSPRKAAGEACKCSHQPPAAAARTAAGALVRERRGPWRCPGLLTSGLRQPSPGGGSPQRRPRRSPSPEGPEEIEPRRLPRAQDPAGGR